MRILILLLISSLTLSLNAQFQNGGYGRITYSVTNGKKISYIQMFFNNDSYAYKRMNNFDTTIISFNIQKTLTDWKHLEGKMQNGEIGIYEANEFIINNTYYQGNNGLPIIKIVTLLNFSKNICSIDTLKLVQWTLIDGEEIIEGRKCRMAEGLDTVTGRRMLAFYDPEIPVSFAPFQFKGLPGLLMKVKGIETGIEIKVVNLYFPIKNGIYDSDMCKNCKLLLASELKKQEDKENQELMKFMENIKKGLPEYINNLPTTKQ